MGGRNWFNLCMWVANILVFVGHRHLLDCSVGIEIDLVFVWGSKINWLKRMIWMEFNWIFVCGPNHIWF